jgi:hypothetical protein
MAAGIGQVLVDALLGKRGLGKTAGRPPTRRFLSAPRSNDLSARSLRASSISSPMRLRAPLDFRELVVPRVTYFLKGSHAAWMPMTCASSTRLANYRAG